MLIADDDRTPLIRTDFSNEAAWRRIVTAATAKSRDGFQAVLHVIDDRAFEHADLREISTLANQSTDHTLLIVADTRAMSDTEMPLLCIDPASPDRQFRTVPDQLWAVENNLSLANMDFSEFVDAADFDGVFRGFAANP